MFTHNIWGVTDNIVIAIRFLLYFEINFYILMIFYYKQINIVLFATSEHIVITLSFLSLKEINYSICLKYLL